MYLFIIYLFIHSFIYLFIHSFNDAYLLVNEYKSKIF